MLAQLAGNRVVLVTDPLVAKDVMIDRPQLFQKEGTAFFPNSSLAGNGLLVSDGATWRCVPTPSASSLLHRLAVNYRSIAERTN
jgi:hypothetical protein